MTEPVKTNLQQPKMNVEPYVGVQTGYDERYGLDYGANGGVTLEKTLQKNSTFYTDINGKLGRNIGANVKTGFEMPFGSLGVVETSLYAGADYRPANAKVHCVTSVEANGTTLNQEFTIKSGLIAYEAGADANIGLKCKRAKCTVGVEGGYQGAYNTGDLRIQQRYLVVDESGEQEFANDVNLKDSVLKDTHGWYVGPKAELDVNVGKNVSIMANGGVRFMNGKALSNGSIGIRYNF